MRYLIIDLETTDLDIEGTEIIQCAYEIVDGDKTKKVNKYYSNNWREITIGARQAHGIRKQDLEGKERFIDSPEFQELKKLEEKCIWITHNGKHFDLKILEREGLKPKFQIDTLKVARNLLWQEQERFEHTYKLEFLRYYLEDELDIVIEGSAHDASIDIEIGHQLFKYLFDKVKKEFKEDEEKKILVEMVNQSNAPAHIAYMPFGKHKGVLLTDLPEGYLKWLNGTDLDEDLRHSVDKIIEGRNNPYPQPQEKATPQEPQIPTGIITEVDPEQFIFDK